MSKKELVEVTIKVPKAFIDHTEKQPWFRYYDDFEDFVMDAVRQRKESWMRQGPSAKELVEKYREAKSKRPSLGFANFLDEVMGM